MGLYLCVFASPVEDDELEGVEVGTYEDFNRLRETIAARLEGGHWGSRFPVLMSHPDSDGEWTPQEALALSHELREIQHGLAALPPEPHSDAGWQKEVASANGLAPTSLAECFIDVDGEPLLERLGELASVAVENACPISFQ